MKLSLDWNCVIEVEEDRPQAVHVKKLIEHHRAGLFEVALLATSASENTKSKRFPGSAKSFKARVAQLDWHDLPIVPMPAIIDLSYIDFSYVVGNPAQFEADRKAIWQAIAPNVPRKPADHLPDGIELNDVTIQAEHLAKWRNTWCDVMSAYSHIHANRDVFVTNNTRDFQSNAKALAELGMRHISTPAEALPAVQSLLE